MTIYVIENKLKSKWRPLAFFSATIDAEEMPIGKIGVSHITYPALCLSRSRVKHIMEIAKENFPKDKFRIREYRNNEK